MVLLHLCSEAIQLSSFAVLLACIDCNMSVSIIQTDYYIYDCNSGCTQATIMATYIGTGQQNRYTFQSPQFNVAISLPFFIIHVATYFSTMK